MVDYIKGSDLPPNLQADAKSRYIHRFTKEHVPGWARGTNYQPQFADDADWLANSEFPVTQDRRRLANRPSACVSHPTWPDGLRAPKLKTYTAFCQELGGGGTIWISSVQAPNENDAAETARAACAADWGYDLRNVHVLGIAEGNVNILTWNDQVE